MGAIEAPGYLEGGDFFPCGRGLAMLGVGLRSNVEAATQLMQRDLLGTDALAVVRDDFEQSQDRMHLDCVFSLLGDDVCLMLDEMMGEESPTRYGSLFLFFFLVLLRARARGDRVVFRG